MNLICITRLEVLRITDRTAICSASDIPQLRNPACWIHLLAQPSVTRNLSSFKEQPHQLRLLCEPMRSVILFRLIHLATLLPRVCQLYLAHTWKIIMPRALTLMFFTFQNKTKSAAVRQVDILVEGKSIDDTILAYVCWHDLLMFDL